MNLRRIHCFLCIDKPAPRDLKQHIMFYHMIENDKAVEKIYKMHSYSEETTTQTTVTWTTEFSYYDHRSEDIGDKNRELPEPDNIPVKQTFPRKRKRRLNNSFENSEDKGIQRSRDPDFPTKKLKCNQKMLDTNVSSNGKSSPDRETKNKASNFDIAFPLKDGDNVMINDSVEKHSVTESNKQDDIEKGIDVSTVEPVVDVFDYDESLRVDTDNIQTDKTRIDQDVIPDIPDKEEGCRNISDLQDVVKKFGNSISILNIKELNDISKPDEEAENIENPDHCSRKENDESMSLPEDNSVLSNHKDEILEINGNNEEDSESIHVTDRSVDEGDKETRKPESSQVVDIQKVAEKLGISISITGDTGDVKEATHEQPDQSNDEDVDYEQSPSSCLESLLERGSISVGKFVNEEVESRDNEDPQANSVESNSEDNETFLSSEEEDLPYGSPLARLLSCGFLSINKIENDSNKKEIKTEEDCDRYACSYCEFTSLKKDLMEKHIFDVHEVAGRPIKQSMSVKVVKMSVNVHTEDESEDVEEDSQSHNEGNSIESKFAMEDEAFNSDEEYDDEDY